MYNVSGRI